MSEETLSDLRDQIKNTLRNVSAEHQVDVLLRCFGDADLRAMVDFFEKEYSESRYGAQIS